MIENDPNSFAAAPAKSHSPEPADVTLDQPRADQTRAEHARAGLLRENTENPQHTDAENPSDHALADKTALLSEGVPPPILWTEPQPPPDVRPDPQFDASVPEDLRTPWGWVDLLLFAGIGIMMLVLVEVIVVGTAIYVFGVKMSDLDSGSTSPAKPIIAVLSQGLWSGMVLLYFFTMVRLKSRSSFWYTMGWRKLNSSGHKHSPTVFQCLAGGAMLAVIISIAGRFLGESAELPIEQMFHSRTTVILLMLFGILVAPLVEETMFRGFLYPVVARRFGIGGGIAVTGILFGAMHAQQLWGGWGQIGLLILVGIALTWVRAHTGTVLASYLVHLGYNSILFLGFFAATGGLQRIPGAR